MKRIIALVGWGVLMAATALPAHVQTSSQIDIDRRDAVVERREFDPANPPAEMPPLKANEAAQCSAGYSCMASSTYSVTYQTDQASGRVTAEVVIMQVDVQIGLSITLWLPRQAPRKLVDHEQGHQRISERVYSTAETVAREEAARVLGRRVTATGTSESEATAAAKAKVDELLAAISDRYMGRVAGYAGRVNSAYDLLTAHGTRIKPDEAAAIERAFELNPATTQPSSSRP